MTRTKIQKAGIDAVNFIKANPDMFDYLKDGDIVEGIVMEKTPRQLVVDLGKYGTGVVYRGELINARSIARNAEQGDKIQAKIIELDNDEGLIELSLSAAEKQKNWSSVEKFYSKEEIIKVKVVSANKGGLMVEVEDIQAFLPASQLTSDNYPDVEGGDKDKIETQLQELIGETLEVRIISADKKSNNLIVSEKAAKEESSKELAKNYEVGQMVEGKVSGVADFGVFIKFADNSDVEGLIHISELSHKLVENPKDIADVDETVNAKIIDISEDGKISLSLKALEEDPWENIDDDLTEGKEVKGRVHGLNPFGATVVLNNGFQAQVHITEFGSDEKMRETLESGKDYDFLIKEVNKEQKRIMLSLK